MEMAIPEGKLVDIIHPNEEYSTVISGRSKRIAGNHRQMEFSHPYLNILFPAIIKAMNGCRLIISAIVLCFVLPVPPVLAAPSIRHLDLQILLQPETETLRGDAILTVLTDGASQLELQLAPRVLIESVSLAGHPLSYEWQGGRLRFSVPAAMRRDEIPISIRYVGAFGDPVPENPVHSEDPTYGVAATIGPRGIFLVGGAGWYPSLPGGPFTFRLRLETPAGIEGVTSGRLVERGAHNGRNYSVWEATTPQTALSLAAGPYRIRTEQSFGIPLYAYFYPEAEKLSETYLRAAKGYLQLYVGLFGPYPFEKFAVVENFFPTGYGFPGWTLLGSTVVPLPFIVETSLGHEIAHSWWGNGVRVAPKGGNWSEGLTTYLADHLYKERSSAAEGREYRLKILRSYASLVPREKDFPLSAFASRTSKATQAVGYGKGAMVFHMARKMVGDQAFWGGLRTLAAERMFQSAGWDDFARAFGEAGHIDLRPFFRQWVEAPGAPTLNLEGVAVHQGSEGWTVTGTIVQSLPAYALSIPLRLETEGGELLSTVAADGERTPFVLQSTAAPHRLLLDPDVDLFRRLSVDEIPPTVNALRASRTLVVVKATGLHEEGLAAGRTLLAALRQESAPVHAEENVTAAVLQGHDILWLGVPRDAALRPPLPPGLSLAPDGFTLDGHTFSRGGASLFVSLTDSADTGRTLALYLPQTAPEAAVVARKIPHYGNDSYLVFVGDRMQLRGTWETGHSPLIQEFLP